MKELAEKLVKVLLDHPVSIGNVILAVEDIANARYAGVVEKARKVCELHSKGLLSVAEDSIAIKELESELGQINRGLDV